MKKSIAVLLCLAMVVCLLAGCGSSSTTADTASDTTAATENSDLGLVGFCSVSMSESIYVMEQEALEEIFDGTYEVQTVSCDNDAATQIQQIKNFITMGADLIIINPTDIEALGDAIKEAHEAGIKVYINGATSDSLSEEYYDCCSVSNEYLCGAYVALVAKNWIEAHVDTLNADNPNWEVAFLESSLSQETLDRTRGIESLVEPYLKDTDGNYVDVSGNVVDESAKVENPAYCEIAAQHYTGTKMEQDQSNGSANASSILTSNPNTRVFVAYNSLASTQGGQYIVDNYPDELDAFAFFSAGVMGDEANYMVGAVSDTDGTKSIMRGACQFGVSAAGGEVADSVARTAYAIMFGQEGVDYFKKNPDGIAAWWTVDEDWGDGEAYVAHFNILSGSTVQAFDPIETLTADDTVIYWNSVDGFVEETEAEDTAAAGTDASTETAAVAGAPIVAGTYLYDETTPFGAIAWTLELNEDGTYQFGQYDNESMGNPTWAGEGWVDNGDGTVTTVATTCLTSDTKIASFWDDDVITWTILNDGRCVPTKADDYADNVSQYGLPEAAASGASGDYDYVFEEATPFGFSVFWYINLNDDGTFEILENNSAMGDTLHTGDTWTDNGDGTFTTGACTEADSIQADFFGDDGSCTWVDNGDGTCTAVGYTG